MHPLLSFYLRTAGIALGGVAALVGIPIVIFGLLASSFASGICGTFVFDEITSPNGKLKAVLFQIDCGATTGFNSHVTIVPSNIDTSQKDALPKSFFIAEPNGNKVPSGKGGGPEVRILWRSDNRLELQYHYFANVIRAEAESKGVGIEYQVFR